METSQRFREAIVKIYIKKRNSKNSDSNNIAIIHIYVHSPFDIFQKGSVHQF